MDDDRFEQERMDRERQLAKSAEKEASGWNRWRLPPSIDRCPGCGAPTHASESNDLGMCARCATPPAES